MLAFGVFVGGRYIVAFAPAISGLFNLYFLNWCFNLYKSDKKKPVEAQRPLWTQYYGFMQLGGFAEL